MPRRTASAVIAASAMLPFCVGDSSIRTRTLVRIPDGPRPRRTRIYPPCPDGRPPLRAQADRAALAAHLGGGAHVGGRRRPGRPRRGALLRPGDAALPERRAAHRPPEELLDRR